MKLYHPFFCFVFVLLLNQACKPDKNKNGWVVLNDTLLPKKSQGIIIKSIATDPKNLEYMNFINYSYFNGANFDGVLKENNQDTANFILEEINQPQII